MTRPTRRSPRCTSGSASPSSPRSQSGWCCACASARRPCPPGSALLGTLARLTHIAFYVLLVAVPVTGILAYWFIPSLGDVHELGKPAFIVLIALHAAAALWHQFWLRDGLLLRMLKPGS
ncbi:MAG TPA: cytochrome b/b6 domain-containing protein [Kaistia sp.]|nr:cytochrome b/b6 domain-containing protein [Kaistia sp.]